MKYPFHNRASRDVRPRRQSAARRSMVSPGARLVRVEHVERVEGGSFEQITTRPLVWNFSTFQPFNTSTYYYTHDMRPRRRRRVARRSVATEPRSGRKRPRNTNVSDVVAFDGLLAAHYEYAPFGKITIDTGGNDGAYPIGQPSSNPFGFSSEYNDETLGLFYYNYRHYVPVYGRWNTYDLAEELFTDNLYLINDNDCIDKTDFLGLKWRECCPGQIGKFSIVYEIYGADEEEINKRLNRAYSLLRSVETFTTLNTLTTLGVTGASLSWQSLTESLPSILLTSADVSVDYGISKGSDVKVGDVSIQKIINMRRHYDKLLYPKMRGRIIYLKCEKGWLWSTSWKERQLGPSNEYEVYANSAFMGKPNFD